MESLRERISKLSPQRLTLLALELQDRVAQLEGAAYEPIAVVSMACRFPGGARTPADYWNSLKHGRDSVSTIPEVRWRLAGTEMPANLAASAHWAASIEDVEMFDPAFFHISPSEAVAMDPQQRLLLEVCWEAIENAGIPAESLAGTDTGVFIGMSSSDYAVLANSQPGVTLNKYVATGAANSIATGRISYLLGLNGPNMAVDTSCSSSATSIHLACQSLRCGESGLALAGGVHLALLPQTNETLSRFNMLAADGRCKAFSDSADGMGRGEGCGVLVLKRLRDAYRDDDNILGVIRGTACNQDGRTSGLTAPNGLAQERVIRAALKESGLEAGDIDYVEAHGTGTPLGDPIEITALGRVFKQKTHERRRVIIGSVKSNIGHLEAAAGVAGVIKVLLALEADEIPASLHCATLNQRVSWDSLPLEVAQEAKAWPRASRRRLAGVSSFGYSGTNVHIVIEEPPRRVQAAPVKASPQMLAVSAKSAEALIRLCHSYAKYLGDQPGVSLDDFTRSVNEGRSHFGHRLAFLASSVEEARRAFAAYRGGTGSGDRDHGDHPERDSYLAGGTVDWKALPHGQSGPKLVLPNYPFERQRYWLDIPATGYMQRAALERNVEPTAPDHTGTEPPISEPTAVEPPASRLSWLYGIAWESLQGVNTPPTLPAVIPESGVDQIMASMTSVLEEAASRVDCSFLPQFRRDTDVLSVQYILQALEQNGVLLSPGRRINTDVCGSFKISPRYERLLGRVFGILEEEGIVQRGESDWVIQHVPARFDTGSEIQRLHEAYPLAAAHLNIFERASFLGQVLGGRMSGLEILFPEGSMALAEALYQQTCHARVMNPIIAELARRAIGLLPASRKLRILELGAGTGSTTGFVLPLMPPDRIEYFFTDVSRHFLAAAARKFSQHAFMRYALHDIENSALVDGLEPGSFDLVIAANVLHATKSLRRTLSNVKNLITPGGFLLLLEASHTERLADITLGTIEGWWRFEDTNLRQRSALIAPSLWQKLLAELGFQSALLPAKPDLFGVTVDEPAILARLEETSSANVAENARKPDRVVVLISPRTAGVAAIASHLRHLGASVIHAVPGETYERLADDVVSLAMDDRAQWSRLFEEVPGEEPNALDVIYLHEAFHADDDPALEAGRIATEAACLLQAVVSRNSLRRSLWFVTRGMQPAVSSSRAPALEASVITGLVRVAASEYPDLSCHSLDRDPEATEVDYALIAGTIIHGRTEGEPELVIRKGLVYAPRLRPATAAERSTPISETRNTVPDAWLVTGGFGVLGMFVARWLAERGETRLILFGRNSPSDAVFLAIEEIRRLGAQVEIVIGDVANEADVQRVFKGIDRSGVPLRGIFHTAAVLEDASVLQLSRASLERVLAPKVAGSWLLHKYSSRAKPEHFVLFSSAASVLGTPGQLNYVMANAFIDALAHRRHSLGLPGVSINWGPWNTSGADVKRDFLADWRAQGGEGMTPSQGLEILEQILRSGMTQAAVLPIDWKTFSAVRGDRSVPAILKDLILPASDSVRMPDRMSSLEDRLDQAAPSERVGVLADYVETRLIQLLGMSRETSIQSDMPFLNLGFDSLMALELKNELQSALKIELSPSVFFEHPTMRDLNLYFTMLFQIDQLSDRTSAVEEGYDSFRI